MAALGCLLLMVLPMLGLIAGGMIGGRDAAIWSAVTGLVVALAICGTAAYALVQAGRRR
jgi:hypothetical protein